MHTLFTLEDIYGLTVSEADGEVCLKLKASDATEVKELRAMLNAWRLTAAMIKSGEITQERYDQWRYHYPRFDSTQRWGKVPSINIEMTYDND